MSLYVHIPFCHHICPYCGFYKHKPGKLANAAFVDAVLAEARWRKDRDELPETGFHTIYMGGGTPTFLSTPLLERLISGLQDTLPLAEAEEFTMEANPATFSAEKIARLRELGVNRISLGVQSFTQSTLDTLGRDHSPADAIEAYETLRKAGMPNVSIDLMFSIPHQTLGQWQHDLEQAIALEPDHISAYNLTYEEDTDFLRRHEAGELDENEDRDAESFELAIALLSQAGYAQYEISNYARPGRESLHNQAYWRGNDYLGLGPGAVSTINRRRWKTLPDTAGYVKATQAGLETAQEIEQLTPADLRTERIALELRTRQGLAHSLVSGHDMLDELIREGFLTLEDERVRLTAAGKPLADPIAAQLI